ncbi:hypothetical protein RRG08_022938 [Elysia crispata]|uniref:Uncharacterized protein n=1 Tax=Elysia crispata TaxID=231223 RepID=A0AAE0XN76_9GAST|nr:hypothetical protein RRG08_022938 [Elysia crispata]
MNKKQDHKSQLDDEKEGYSDQTERKQKDSNTRTIRDAFLQLLSKDAKEPRGRIGMSTTKGKEKNNSVKGAWVIELSQAIELKENQKFETWRTKQDKKRLQKD